MYTALTAAKPKTRYVVTPQPRTNWMGVNLPKRMMDNIMAGRLGLKRQA